tara:strand:+ start:4322 stop:4696 length:375 start_codon:yes stop_codon:yes gene_type:complete
MDNTKSFNRHDNGFSLRFDNGLVLSTVFGTASYTENKDRPSTSRPRESLHSDTVEVAVWDDSYEGLQSSTDASGRVGFNRYRPWVTDWIGDIFNADVHDDVRGWVTMNEWLKLVEWCRNWKKES